MFDMYIIDKILHVAIIYTKRIIIIIAFITE